jgi:hypothetical protein
MKKIALELRPFTRLIWKNKEMKEEWLPKINQASRLYNITEWKMVSEGLRKCGTIHLNRRNFEGMLERLEKDGMFFKPISRTAKYQGFSHRHIVPEPNEDYDVYGVICKNKEDCDMFAKWSNSSNDEIHNEIAKLLKYPDCCAKAFTTRWNKGIIDPMFEAGLGMREMEYLEEDGKEIINLDSVPIEGNQMLRYFGLRTTSHLPCSFDCLETKEIAKDWIRTMKKIDSEGLEYLKELLSLDFSWNAYYGIVEVDNKLFRGITTTGFNKTKRIINVGRNA